MNGTLHTATTFLHLFPDETSYEITHTLDDGEPFIVLEELLLEEERLWRVLTRHGIMLALESERHGVIE